MPAMTMAHDIDPKSILLETIGDLSNVSLFHNQVLVAIYVRPEKTKSGIILPDKVRDEDEHQGKVGLIVKTGDTAFADPHGVWSWPKGLGLNDWIFFRASDGWAIKINGQMCRILDDVRVRGRIESPDQVW